MNPIHKFESAGLGLAPYKFQGVTTNLFTPCPGAPSKPGGSCDYCSTGILYEFHLESADGKRFKVGSDCILKAGDLGLEKHVASHKKVLRRKQAEASAKREREVVQGIRDEIKALLASREMDFRKLAHPLGYSCYGKPLTAYDYGTFMVSAYGSQNAAGYRGLLERLQAALDTIAK